MISQAVQELVTDIINDISDEAKAIAVEKKDDYYQAVMDLPVALEWVHRLPEWSRAVSDCEEILNVLINSVHIRSDTLSLFGGTRQCQRS